MNEPTRLSPSLFSAARVAPAVRRRWLAAAPALACLAAGASLLTAPAHAQPCTLSEFERQFNDVVTRVQTGVVSVIAYSDLSPLDTLEGDALQSVKQSVGSGIVIDQDGHVLTTRSVIGESRTLLVRSHDGDEHPAVWLGSDAQTDLALLQVTEVSLRPVTLGESSSLKEGCWLITVGQPHSNYPDRSFGAFSSVSYSSETAYGTPLLEMTAPVYPGQSGGAVVDVRGAVVGLLLGEMSAAPDAPAGEDGERSLRPVSAAVPIDVARRVAAMLAEHGTASPGYLGVKVRMPTQKLRELLRFKNGVLIDEVVAGSPAAVVAIEPGDVILSFEGEPVTGPTELVRMVSGRRPGTVCNLLLLRGDVKISRTVTLGAVPFAFRAAGPSGPAMSAGVNSRTDTSNERINAKIRRLQAEINRLQREISQER